MPASYPPEWFQMADVRRRRLSGFHLGFPFTSIRGCCTKKVLISNLAHSKKRFASAHLAVYADQREIGETLGWSSIGLIHTPGPYAFWRRPLQASRSVP